MNDKSFKKDPRRIYDSRRPTNNPDRRPGRAHSLIYCWHPPEQKKSLATK